MQKYSSVALFKLFKYLPHPLYILPSNKANPAASTLPIDDSTNQWLFYYSNKDDVIAEPQKKSDEQL